SNLLALEKDLKGAKQMLTAAEHDRDMHRQGLAGTREYTVDEIMRVDAQLLNQVNLREETRIRMEDLEIHYGPAFPQVLAYKQELATRERNIQEKVKKFNDTY